MTPVRSIVMPTLEDLAERYMQTRPTCVVCQEWPATKAMIFVADATDKGRMRGAVFGICARCWCQDDFESNVAQALRQDQAQRTAVVWN
jgi:hypothetical protein